MEDTGRDTAVCVNEEHDVILYPPGGAFNKLRSKQAYLDFLLEDAWLDYSTAAVPKKREFIRTNILDPLKATGRVLKVFRGRTPDSGCLMDPSDEEAEDRISQKLRDKKKRKLMLQSAGLALSESTKVDVKTSNPFELPPTQVPRCCNGEDLTESLDFTFGDEEMSVDGSFPTLQHIIEKQWSTLDDMRLLCARQKKSIEKLTSVLLSRDIPEP